MAIDTARETALKILYDINEKGAYSNISVNRYLEEGNLSGLDRSFVTELVYGSLSHKLAIDWVIGQFSNIRINRISPWILNIIRLGVYQILFMSRVPDSAACNESVNLAGRYGHKASSGFVNGILRNISRNKNNIKYPDKEKEPEKFLSVKYSYPEWLTARWLSRYGPEFAERFMDSGNQPAEFVIRTNTIKTSPEALARKLEDQGFQVQPGKYVEEALIIENPSEIFNSAAFKEGLFQVQDESSMLVGKILNPVRGEFVIDVCAAPGGKTTHIAALMGGEGKVLARDIHPHKINIINQTAERLGIGIIETEVSDAALTDKRYAGAADRVLVDAPCSGFGIIRRKPDIKWSRSEEDLKTITELQKKILRACAEYVKPGGVLVYSTCTIEPDENERIVEEFTETDKRFYLTDITLELPEGLKKPSASGGYVQFYPHVDGIDGFFISKMRRRDG